MPRFVAILAAILALSSGAFASPVDQELEARAPSAADKAAYLNGHNTVRARHNAKALVWSDTLANAAQNWANRCKFQHSGGAVGAYGENLYAGTGSLGTVANGLNSWANEVSQYNPNSPVASHWTQMVWKSTTQIGCASAQCDGIFDPKYGKAAFHVCEYSPPGNYGGQYGANVQKN